MKILAPLLVAAATALTPVPARAKIVSRDVSYQQGKVELVGYLAYDDAKAGKRPGVIVVHDWMGISEETKRRAKGLAELGYVAFAADVYGKGVRPANAEEAGKLAGKYLGDRKLLRARLHAALAALIAQPNVDGTRVGAQGYCFGGSGALELARSGAAISAVISFHGGLATPTPADMKSFKGKVLVFHGADDPHVPPDQVAAFQKELRDAGVDWEFVSYGGAVHAFTNPGAGTDPSKGVAYDARADRRSWEQMREFYREVFGATP